MKILFLIDGLVAAGKERQLIEVLKGLHGRQDIESQLAIFSDVVHYEYIEELNVKTTVLKRKFKKDPAMFRELYKICKDFQPDIIHSWNSMTSVYAAPVARLLGIKFINNLIQDAPTRLKPFSGIWMRSKLTFPLSDVVLANSIAGLNSYGAPMYKSHYVRNGFDFTRVEHLQSQADVREKFNIRTPKVVGMVARFHIGKDYQTFVRAAMRILEKRDDVTFLAIGDGETREECREMVAPEYRGRILFPGRLSNIESIVNIFDVGVLLTNPAYHGEGIANSIMEYMALGKPVVATIGGGTGEIVIHNENGFILEPRNDEAIAEKIDYLLSHPEIAAAMGSAGEEKLHREFGLDYMTDRFVELYEQCVENTFHGMN